jgi:uncharacterized membrane protein YozB (DUF420 family)
MSVHDLPAVNAALNAVSFVLLLLGWRFVKQGRIAAHKAAMTAAFVSSTLFLASYVLYHTVRQIQTGVGSTPFPGEGLWRTIYFLVLVPHVVLAVVMSPMILLLLYRALRGEFDRHKRLARITLPIWLYVSITGVVVYVMLYRVDWN